MAGDILLKLRADFDAGFVRPQDRVAVIAASDLLGSRAAHAMPMELARGMQPKPARKARCASATR